MDNTINYTAIYNHVFRFVKNEAIAWECVAEAYLSLDDNFDIKQQASYLYKKTIDLAKTKYRERQKSICFSNLDTLDKEGKEQSFLDTITYEAFKDSDDDLTCIAKILNEAEEYLREPLGLLLNSILDNKFCGRGGFTETNIWWFLYRYNYKPPQGFKILQIAKQCYKFLQSYYNGGLS